MAVFAEIIPDNLSLPLVATTGAAILLTAFILARRKARATARARTHFVTTYTFPARVQAVLVRERPDLGPEMRNQAWEALRQYFLLHAHKPGRFLGMPSETADAAWHAFILCSREYETFCASAFGRFLHHVPDENARPGTMTATSAFKRETIATWDACKELRCARPDLMLSAIPLLFLLDSKTGSGWIHTPASLAALEQHSTCRPSSSYGGSGTGSSCGGICGGCTGSSCGGGCGGCGG